MKKTALLALIMMQAALLFAQKPPTNKPEFDVAGFKKKADIAEWLVRYDTVAWKTTDLMVTLDKSDLARLGHEWFCFQDEKNTWHAIYGKLENNKYDQVFHFVVDASGNISRTADRIEDAFAISHARALATARAKVREAIPVNSPVHNSFIRRNPDNTFSVWLLPAFQPDSTAVYGSEFIYTIDRAGEKVLKDESYFQGKFRGFKSAPPREIFLDYSEKKEPTLGAIFFVLYYKDYFTKIYIDNSGSSTLLIKGDDGYIWTHVIKDDKQPPAPK